MSGKWYTLQILKPLHTDHKHIVHIHTWSCTIAVLYYQHFIVLDNYASMTRVGFLVHDSADKLNLANILGHFHAKLINYNLY